MTNIVLFFTKDVSLKTWDRVGMFDRELALYRKLQRRGYKISFITYGKKEDLDFQERIKDINILCNRWNLKGKIYQFLIPLLHRKSLKEADVFKTNQVSGGLMALLCSKIYRKPLVARCGYMFSEFEVLQKGEKSFKTFKAKWLEKIVFSFANKVVVTTEAMKNDIKNRIPKAYLKTFVIPNYVETDRFKNLNLKKEYDLIFVGRIAEQKNLKSLLYAIKDMKIKIAIVGKGKFKEKFQSDYSNAKAKIDWLGKGSNSELPAILNKGKIYILPSFYEGNPKTLIEAMACGLPVIGANSVGIKEIIKNEQNGLLCETDSESIKRAVERLLDDDNLCKKLGDNARKYAIKIFALDKIIEEEKKIYNSLTGNKITPQISVVMSVYNGKKHLKEAVDSILNQTFKDFEFIIIDDASTDDTLDILKSYNDKRIKIIKNENNLGLSASLNRGFKIAKGKYIARMDADDISLPTRFEEQFNFMENNVDIGVLGTNYQRFGRLKNVKNIIAESNDEIFVRILI